MKFYKFENPFVLIVSENKGEALETYNDEIGDVEETEMAIEIDKEEAVSILSKTTGEDTDEPLGKQEAINIINEAISNIEKAKDNISTTFNAGMVLALSRKLL